MKRLFLEYIPLTLLLVVAAGIAVHTPATVWLTSQGAPTWVKAWKEILIIIAAFFAAFDVVVTRTKIRIKKSHRVLVWSLIANWALHVVALSWSHGTAESISAGLLIDLRYTVFAAVMYLFLIRYPWHLRKFFLAFVAGAIIVIGFAALQTLLPKDMLTSIGYSDQTIQPYLTVDKNPNYIRINSTLRGPNSLGAYAVIVLAGVAAYRLSRKKHTSQKWHRALTAALGIGALLALWHSYSRSAGMAAIVAVFLLLLLKYRSRLNHKTMVYGSGVLLVIAGLAYMVRDTSFVHNVILHDDPSTGDSVTSNDAHAQSLSDGVQRMFAEPLGSGIGSTGSASLMGDRPMIIENQYLMIAHETGWIGLALFVIIYVSSLLLMWRHRQDWTARMVLASGIGLGLIGILLPVWADDTVSLAWWGLLGMIGAKGISHERTTNEETA